MDFKRKIIERESYDVIVVGGGIAGICASVSASRRGAKTFLIEKSVNLGGLATNGLISWYEPLCDGKGTQLVKGMAEELILLCTKYGPDNLPKSWGGNGHNKQRNHRYSTFFSPTIFSAALDKFVMDNGVDLRFDTLATYPVMNGSVCQGIIAESCNGTEFFGAKAVIDATGDASIMKRAGVPTVIGENYMTFISHYCDIKGAQKLSDDGDFISFRQWLNTGSDMFGNGHPDGMNLLTGKTAEEITQYMTTGKLSLLNRIEKLDKNSFEIMALPFMPQMRTIRRIVGKVDFNAVNGELFDDAIGNCGDFRPDYVGNRYQIPFGALYNGEFPNLLAAGRIISAPQGDGWEIARVIPNCALTGEAAGKAAALYSEKSYSFDNIRENHIDKISV